MAINSALRKYPVIAPFKEWFKAGYTKLCYEPLSATMSHYESLQATMSHYESLWATMT